MHLNVFARMDGCEAAPSINSLHYHRQVESRSLICGPFRLTHLWTSVTIERRLRYSGLLTGAARANHVGHSSFGSIGLVQGLVWLPGKIRRTVVVWEPTYAGDGWVLRQMKGKISAARCEQQPRGASSGFPGPAMVFEQ